MRSTLVAAALIILFPAVAVASGEVHWSHSGENGPEHWGALSEEFAACDTGTQQSPINLAQPTVKEHAEIELNWSSGEWDLINNGHAIQVQSGDMGTAVIEGDIYKLLQFHFHLPSEHAIEGERSAMEVHFVHSHEDGRLAVIGVMIEAGGTNNLFSSIMASAPDAGGSVPITVSDATELAGDLGVFYRYWGSLTTPPCSEIVTWSVARTPVLVSEGDIAAFRKLYEHNARPVQEIKFHSVTTSE